MRLNRLLLTLLLSFSISIQAKDPKDSILLNFENADLRTIISVISKETNKNFLLDPRVRKQKITLIAQKPVNRKDAYGVFLSILRIYGYGLVESGQVTKIVPISELRQNETGFVDKDEFLQGDGMATIILPLENTKTEQMAGIIRPMIPSFGQVIAHGDSNSLIVLGPLGVLNKVRTIVDELEGKVEKNMQILTLKYANSTEIIAIINKLEKKAVAKTNGLLLIEDKRSNQVIISGGTKRDQARVIYSIKKLDTARKNNGNAQVIYLNYAKAKELAVLLKEIVVNTTNKDDKNSQKISISADENTNSLVVYAPSSMMLDIKNIIAQLDIRKAQVLVQAIIVETSDNNAAQLGVRWGINTNKAVGLIDFTGAGSLVNLAAGNAGLPNPLALGSGSSLVLGSVSGNKGWGALVKALRSDSGVNILSNPSVITLDNEEASIVVGQEIPFITGQSTQNSGNPFTTIQRKEVGLKLKVTPQINHGDAMQLKIEQEVSSLQTSARNATGASDIITAKRSINTSVIINDGQVLVLGGLTTQQSEESAEKVPGLSDIPIIGGLFKSEQNQSEKRTLMVFIKTNIVRDFDRSNTLSHEKYKTLYDIVSKRKSLDLINKNNKIKLTPTHEYFPNLAPKPKDEPEAEAIKPKPVISKPKPEETHEPAIGAGNFFDDF